MARPREFDTSKVLTAAANVFQNYGYEGASIEQLVEASGLQRGSLYQAFGSKSGLFQASLSHIVKNLEDGGQKDYELVVDILIVALWECAKDDKEVRKLIGRAIPELEKSTRKNFDRLLVQQFSKRSRIQL